jgi:transcriptional regulator with XRE-family HTH domain
MLPDARKHNPDPLYLRALIERTGLSQAECARIIGVSARTLREYLALEGKLHEASYPVQFALECLAGEKGSEN